MRHPLLTLGVMLSVWLLWPPAHAVAQEPPSLADQIGALAWQRGPVSGAIGDLATIEVPEGFAFLGKGDAGKFLELLENPSDGTELGLLLSPDSTWFVTFEFTDDGYVRDDDRELDADALLDSIREGTEHANTLRKERGWSAVEVVGWQTTPFYDPQTHNLTWAITGRSDGGDSINHSTRLLGRRGVMRVNLVLSPEDSDAAKAGFAKVMSSFSFNPGHRYSEFTTGDKVAEYGLTGLIVGGTGVALAKSGLLQKFWKLIVFGIMALAGTARKLFARLTGRAVPTDASGNV